MIKLQRQNRAIGNVLLVANFPSGTAYAWWLMEQLWLAVAKLARTQGYTVYLAYPEVTGVNPAIENAGIRVIELPIPGSSPAEMIEVARFIRANRIKTLYFTDRPWFAREYALLRLAGVERILVHDHTPGDRPSMTGWRRLLKSWRNRSPGVTADYLFCVSPLMRDRNIANGCIPPDRCLVVQNGIEPLIHTEGDRERLRAELGIEPDTTAVITTGRAHPYKRFDLVIETAAHVRSLAGDKRIIFLLVGDGPALDSLRQLVEQRQLTEDVRLLGYRADTRQLLAAADIAMHAARGEGFSLSILEYMSAGLPVLVPDIPSVCQAVDPTTGIVYPRNDHEFAAKAVLTLTMNPEIRERLGNSARQKVAREFHLGRSLKELEDHLLTMN